MFTRLSLTHPHNSKANKKNQFEPAKRLTLAINVYPRHEDKLAENEAQVLEHEQTGMLFDLHELRYRLRMSITWRITLLEQRRIARLTGAKIEDEPIVISEFGGLGFVPQATEDWFGYGQFASADELLARYEELVDALLASTAFSNSPFSLLPPSSKLPYFHHGPPRTHRPNTRAGS